MSKPILNPTEMASLGFASVFMSTLATLGVCMIAIGVLERHGLQALEAGGVAILLSVPTWVGCFRVGGRWLLRNLQRTRAKEEAVVANRQAEALAKLRQLTMEIIHFGRSPRSAAQDFLDLQVTEYPDVFQGLPAAPEARR